MQGEGGRLNEIIARFGSYTQEPYIRLENILPIKEDTPEEKKAVWGVEEIEETDVVLFNHETELEYSFDSVDGVPLPVFDKIAEICKDLKVSIKYACDNLEEAVSLISPVNSSELIPEEVENEFELACEIWDRDPEEEQYELWINEMEE